MKNIHVLPTAEEFFNNFCNKRTKVGQLNGAERLEVMIEFAKLHVEAALQAASEQVEFDEEALIRQSILQAYPLDLIK